MASSSADPENPKSPNTSDGFPFKINIDAAAAKNGLSLEQYRALVGMPQEPPRSSLSLSQGKLTQSGIQSSVAAQSGFTKTRTGLHSVSDLNTANDQTRNQISKQPVQIRPATVTFSSLPTQGSRILTGLRILSRPSFKTDQEAAEYATSFYYTIIREESDQKRLSHIYNIVTYTCLVGQLMIASVLIILGAIPASGNNASDSKHRIPVAVLGAVTGLLTGLLSLLKGQGLPMRLLQYASRLRQLRDKLEFLERALRAEVGAIVTLQDVINLWNEFEQVRNEKTMNRPDVYTTASQVPAIAGVQQWSQQEDSQNFSKATGFRLPVGQQQPSQPRHDVGPQTPRGAAASATGNSGITGALPDLKDPPIPPPNRGSSSRVGNGGANTNPNSGT